MRNVVWVVLCICCFVQAANDQTPSHANLHFAIISAFPACLAFVVHVARRLFSLTSRQASISRSSSSMHLSSRYFSRLLKQAASLVRHASWIPTLCALSTFQFYVCFPRFRPGKAMVKKFLVFQARTHRFWRPRRFFFSTMYSGKSGTRSRKKRRFSRFFGLLQVGPDHAGSISFFPAHCFLVTVSTSLRKSCATARIDFPDGTSRFRARETSESS